MNNASTNNGLAQGGALALAGPVSSVSMAGKTCVVTGASSGIGKATAQALAAMGAEVVMVCRSRERGEAALSEIQGALQGQGRLELKLADLSIMSATRALGDDLKRNHPRIHVLVNNAGAIFRHRNVTPEGLEYTFALNHMSYFILTTQLLDTLKGSAPARIINVSSGAHTRGKIPLDDLQYKRAYNPFAAYSDTKLANVLFTYELARRLEGSGVTCNCMHPGAVATGFSSQDGPPLFKWFFKWFRPFLLTPERGAETAVYLASSPAAEGVSGKYFIRCKMTRSSRRSRDEELAQKLWEASERLLRGTATTVREQYPPR
ncbi:MAG TPA: SDR family oxidoreductase [Polyangia bacterium]|jgi:NAD(P)-dependent dehydrogenase (short-subunit alcohol dehydrogenase family)|nr:SDR family oxidoreductase [Polyangia bacterium]